MATGRAIATLLCAALPTPATVAQELRTLDSTGFHSATHDSVRGRTVAVGLLGETLEFDGAVWRQRPTERIDVGHGSFATLEFDAASGRALMLRVPAPGGNYMEVSEYDGVEWRHDLHFPAPLLRTYFASAFDAARSELVMFGGFRQPSIFYDETWAFDGSSWSQRAPLNSPSARTSAVAAYDSARARVVLFGGAMGIGTSFNDTWEWNGTTWTQIVTANAPTPRGGVAMAFDPIRNRMALFGGLNITLGFYDDTWEYDGIDWTAVQPTGARPPARSLAALTFDTTLGECVLAGGADGAWLYDSWSWDGVRWQPVAAPTDPQNHYRASAALHPNLDATVIVDYQTQPASSWSFANNQWTQVAGSVPPGRHSEATATGPEYAYVYGGRFFANSLTDLWGFDGTAWSLLSSTGPTSAESSMAFDWNRNELVLFGGRPATTPVNDTWVWDGNSWQQRTPATRPPARFDAAMAYDFVRQRIVLFGGTDAAYAALLDTWEWDGTNWSLVPTTATPPAGRATMTFDHSQGEITLVVDQILFVSSQRWTFDGVDWGAAPLQQVPYKPYDNATLLGYASGPRAGTLVLVDEDNISSLTVEQATTSHYGSPCTPTAPDLTTNDWPRIGTAGFVIEVVRAPASSLIALLGAVNNATVNIAGCTQLVQPGQAALLLGTTPGGGVTAPLVLPPNVAFVGVNLYFQAAALDPAAPSGFTLSRGLQLTLGR